MKKSIDKERLRVFVAGLCPGLDDEELTQAEESFEEYLRIAMRIHQRIREEEERRFDRIGGEGYSEEKT